ncbi:hypothetical protein JOE29_001265 [Pseudomonas sp. PvP009]|uniref:hypothetical protein n=1 Tax=Pseudomonas sp. PvP009 TaxID=2806584 RepID=UPI001AE7BADF|nr:hypothetical protein [Pseudomonas sp. PvP009]MBP1139314.1 hypothetical protein [Pseudomonas sp. PvP009]
MLSKEKSLHQAAARFHQDMPFQNGAFSKRNWGHALHSLCSYQGKLKPAMAHWLVKEFVPEGGRLLDLLGGVGTIPFEAALQGREAVSNDKSPFPATVATAKLDPPTLEEALSAWQNLWLKIEEVELSSSDIDAAHFGLNGKVCEYYHPDTLREVLKARNLFLEGSYVSKEENFAWASLLHVLHGNRPYALSRTSHPITPFSPSGEFVYKSVYEKVRNKISTALKTPLPNEFLPGVGLYGDFRDLNSKDIGLFDAIITSPPFLGMRFDRPNWLRLWFCGWSEVDFHERSLGFLERQQIKSSECYAEFIDQAAALLKPSGTLIIHIGSGDGKGKRLDVDIANLAAAKFNLVYEIKEDVSQAQKHGIKDKGMTKYNHLLFYVKNQ